MDPGATPQEEDEGEVACPNLPFCPHRFWEPDWISWAAERLVVPIIPLTFMYLFRRNAVMHPHAMGFADSIRDVARGPEVVFYGFIVLAGAFVEAVAAISRGPRDRHMIRFALAGVAVMVGLFAADRLVTMLAYYDAIIPYEESARGIVQWAAQHPGEPLPAAMRVIPYPLGLDEGWVTKQLWMWFVPVLMALGAQKATRYANGRVAWAPPRAPPETESPPPGAPALE